MPVHCGEEAEQDPHQESFQIVARVAAGLQGVVQVVHDGDRSEIDRVVVLEAVLLVAGNEGELVDIAVQVGKRKFGRLDPVSGKQRQRPLVFRLQIVQGEAGEVGDDDVARHLVLHGPRGADPGYTRRLATRPCRGLAAALVLDQQHALPNRSMRP